MGGLGQRSMITHNFEKSMDFADSYEGFAFPLYERLFDGEPKKIEDIERQMDGADVIVCSTRGNIYIEEKIREKSYTDYLFETWSSLEDRKPGWIEKDALCHYLSYICIETRTVNLLPWPLLRDVWKRMGTKWTFQYGEKHIPNEGYTTVCVCVPKKEVHEQLTRTFSRPIEFKVL